MRKNTRGRTVARVAGVSTVATAMLVSGSAVMASAAQPATTPAAFTITTVSNPRPELVSGDQVLVRVTPPTAGAPVTVTVDGRDVTSSFATQDDGTLLGLVTGLNEGANRLVARTPHVRTSLTVTDHPITGPVFSGPQQTPFYCQTTSFGLAASVQPLCSAPTQVTYEYKTIHGNFKPLATPSDRPANLATATVDGRSVPYVVRVETGTIDRGVYQTAALYDGQDPSPLRPDTSWNQKLVYTFGGGCNSGYHQGTATGGVLNDLFLSQGYAVASNTLNVLDNNCSTIISAEAAMMTKEHFIDTYGPVLHTIGWGGSGGAIQQYAIADEYPGIVDGIIPGISFPDPLTTAGPVADCKLLDRFFAGAGSTFTAAQQQAVAGYEDYTTCKSWDATFANRGTATGSCNVAIPLSVQWNRTKNPNGVICNSEEQLVNQLGVDPTTGFVNQTLDNTGMQYGLAALEAGTITAAQFVQLNTAIGGVNYAGKPVAQRVVASATALSAAYATDLFNSASQGLTTTPVIDQRTDLDLLGFGYDIHTTDWSFIMRARLLAANGTFGNQVIIENQATPNQEAAASSYELSAMDRWLTGIESDHSGATAQQKVLTDKPADLTDGCYLSATKRVSESLTYPTTGKCGAVYPVFSNPRLVAGEQLSMTTLKCSLAPIDFSDYPPNTFTNAQENQLRKVFASGVCDYSRPGQEYAQPLGSWLSYGDETTGLTPPTKLPPLTTR